MEGGQNNQIHCCNGTFITWFSAICVVGDFRTAVSSHRIKILAQTSAIGPQVSAENSRQLALKETEPPILRAFVGMVTIRKQ